MDQGPQYVLFDVETLSGQHHRFRFECQSNSSFPSAADADAAAAQAVDGVASAVGCSDLSLVDLTKSNEAVESKESVLNVDENEALRFVSLSNIRRRLLEVDVETKVSQVHWKDEMMMFLDPKNNVELDDDKLNELCKQTLQAITAASALTSESALPTDSESNQPVVHIRCRLRRYPVYADLFRLLKLNAQSEGIESNRRFKFPPRLLFALIDSVLIILSSFFLSACAQASFQLPSSWSNDLGLKSQVPITFQTFAVLLTAMLLGSWRATLSSLIYLLMIVAGAPFGALHSGGYKVLYGASAGYLWSYPMTSLVVGKLAERGWDRSYVWCTYSMLLGTLVIYTVGLIWLPFGASINSKGYTAGQIFCGAPHGCVGNVLYAGLIPFIPGDLIKIGMAVFLLPFGWKIMPIIATWLQRYFYGRAGTTQEQRS